MLAEVFVGIILRLGVVVSPLCKWLEARVEVNTPATSWKRVEEGIALIKYGLDPYQGDIVHEPPLNILVYSVLSQYSSYAFIVLDVVTALLLKVSVDKIHATMVQTEQDKECHATFSEQKIQLVEKTGYYSLLAFLFNPYTLALCVTKSTQCTNNMFYGVVLYGISTGNVVVVAVATALLSYSSLFPVMVLIPVLLHHRDKSILGILSFGLTFASLHLLSYHLTGGWGYVHSVYGFIITVPDYTPNIGAAWYFFAEMFSHFTVLFLCVYQVNLILYAVPLSLRFPRNPPLVVFSLLMLLAMFKPYTTVGDYVIPLAMLPLWLHLVKYLNQFYVVIIATVVLTLLWPIMWYLWVDCLNANSNFYFAITLAFVLFQSFLLSDVLYAEMRREYAFKHGVARKKIDGVDAVLSLS